MGHSDGLKEAETILNQPGAQRDTENTDRFEIVELNVPEDSDLSGKSLAALNFRQKFGATVVGIRRGRERITTVNPAEHLRGGDCLIVIGKSSAIKAIQQLAPCRTVALRGADDAQKTLA
jgi:K+/H+ antiporter YhaU regulatory subunit KhtT